MIVVGNNFYIIGLTGETMDISPFTPDYESLKKVLLFDAALIYLCEYTGKESLIVVRNALYVPSMEINLIPPFILREAGVTVNDKPKTHVLDPSLDDHAIIFENNGIKIPLKVVSRKRSSSHVRQPRN